MHSASKLRFTDDTWCEHEKTHATLFLSRYTRLTACVRACKRLGGCHRAGETEFKQITEAKSDHYAKQTLCFTCGKQVGA